MTTNIRSAQQDASDGAFLCSVSDGGEAKLFFSQLYCVNKLFFALDKTKSKFDEYKSGIGKKLNVNEI